MDTMQTSENDNLKGWPPTLTDDEWLELEFKKELQAARLGIFIRFTRTEAYLSLIKAKVAPAWRGMPDDWLINIVREMQFSAWSVGEVDSVIADPHRGVYALLEIKKMLKQLVDFVLHTEKLNPLLATKALNELQGHLIRYMARLSSFDLSQVGPGETRDHVQEVQEAINSLLNRAFIPLSIILASELPNYPKATNILQKLRTPPQEKLYKKTLAIKIREALFKDKRLLEVFLTNIVENYEPDTKSTHVWLRIDEEAYLYAVVKKLMLEIFSKRPQGFSGWQLPLELSVDIDEVSTYSDSLEITNAELGVMFHIVETMRFISLLREGLEGFVDGAEA
jgi:hypothetical protein